MNDSGRFNVLGVTVDAIDYEGAVARIISAARQRQPCAVTALAVHGVLTGVLDAPQRSRLNQLDLVVPDGQPVRWALNWLYRTRLIERVYGPELMLRVCVSAAAEQLPIFMFGTNEATLQALEQRLCAQIPGLIVAGVLPSRYRRLSAAERDELVDRIRGSGAAIVFVGIGCPRQEAWAFELRDRLAMPILAVGAAFDFHAGFKPQAPPSLQRLGLEWCYRLWQEPRRLWKRYLLLNPLYLIMLALQRSGLVRFDSPTVEDPPELMFG